MTTSKNETGVLETIPYRAYPAEMMAPTVTGAITRRAQVGVTSYQPQTMDELVRFATTIADSDLVPKEMRGRTANIILAIQLGAELGMKPIQAIQSIAVINGRPSVWGDGLLGLIQASGLLEDFDEQLQYDEKGNLLAAACMVKRVGRSREKIVVFTMEDAKKANLIGKPGPWMQYPKRMLQLRARAFALRDEFADVLKGMQSAEEALDMAMDELGSEAAPVATARGDDKAQAVRDRMADQMRKQTGQAAQTGQSNHGNGQGGGNGAARPAPAPATGPTLAKTKNTSGAVCPSCMAPDGKLHSTKCMATAAPDPAHDPDPAIDPAADPPGSGIGGCAACGSADECDCTPEAREAAYWANQEAQSEQSDMFAGE